MPTRRPRQQAAPPPPTPTTAIELTEFEGRTVIGTSVKITNAGDGLSQALSTEPEELHIGDTVYVVLECQVGPVRFDPVKDTNALRRVHTLKTITATTAAQDLVEDILDEQREKNRVAALDARLARDAAKGAQQIPTTDGAKGIANDGSAAPEADPANDPANAAEVAFDDDGNPL